MKNLRKISRSQLKKILGADRFDLCSSIVEHDGSAGNRCDCDLHCNSRKCSLGKCL
ncbi:bacteriocin-like protein [Chryseobacterium aquaticum]